MTKRMAESGRMRSAALLTVVFACLLVVLASSPVRAEEDYANEAYRMYFKYHPAASKPTRTDYYPYPGPIIHAGEDLSICADARQPETYVREKRTNQRYLLHGKDGWIFSTPDFRTDYAPSPQAMEYFDRLNKALKAKGQKLVIFFGPPRAMLEARHFDPAEVPKGYTPGLAQQGYEAFIHQLRSLGIAVVGITDAPADVDYFHTGDVHWTLAGARYSAGVVAEAIRDIPAYADIDRQDFESEAVGFIKPELGGYEATLGRMCRMNIEIHSDQAWATSIKTADEAAADASLLGDTAFPAITALGTSYVSYDDRFDFVGRLKSLLRADVYNAAITGGGFAGASYRYYASDEYHDHPPKIILWEFIYLHNYNKEESLNGFRQMIPAIQGACSAKDALAAYSGDVTSGATDFLGQAQNRPLKDTYLYFDLTGPAGRQVNLRILYADGNADDIDMTRSTRAPDNGKYYLELADNTPAPAVLFRLVTDKAEGHLEARLCRYPAGTGRP